MKTHTDTRAHTYAFCILAAVPLYIAIVYILVILLACSRINVKLFRNDLWYLNPDIELN